MWNRVAKYILNVEPSCLLIRDSESLLVLSKIMSPSVYALSSPMTSFFSTRQSVRYLKLLYIFSNLNFASLGIFLYTVRFPKYLCFCRPQHRSYRSPWKHVVYTESHVMFVIFLWEKKEQLFSLQNTQGNSGPEGFISNHQLVCLQCKVSKT